MIGALGVSLVLPGGLLFLLYWVVRSQRRAAATLNDPYIEWLRARDRWRQGQNGAPKPSRPTPAAAIPEDSRLRVR